MKKLFLIPIALALVGCGGGDIATTLSAQTMTNKANVVSGSSGPCPGSYQAKTTYLRSTTDGVQFVSVPAGKTNFAATYTGVITNGPTIRVSRKHDFAVQCGASPKSWTGTVGATHQFRFEMFWTGANPPATGDLATVNITWLP